MQNNGINNSICPGTLLSTVQNSRGGSKPILSNATFIESKEVSVTSLPISKRKFNEHVLLRNIIYRVKCDNGLRYYCALKHWKLRIYLLLPPILREVVISTIYRKTHSMTDFRFFFSERPTPILIGRLH